MTAPECVDASVCGKGVKIKILSEVVGIESWKNSIGTYLRNMLFALIRQHQDFLVRPPSWAGGTVGNGIDICPILCCNSYAVFGAGWTASAVAEWVAGNDA